MQITSYIIDAFKRKHYFYSFVIRRYFDFFPKPTEYCIDICNYIGGPTIGDQLSWNHFIHRMLYTSGGIDLVLNFIWCRCDQLYDTQLSSILFDLLLSIFTSI